MGSVLESFGAFQGYIWSILLLSQWRTERDQKFQFCYDEKFLMGAQAQTYMTSFGVLCASFGPFLAKSEMMFFQNMPIYVKSFLVIFGLFGPFYAFFGTQKHLKHQKYTNCNPLGEKQTNKIHENGPQQSF